MENMDIEAAFAQGMMAAMIESPQFKIRSHGAMRYRANSVLATNKQRALVNAVTRKYFSGYMQKILSSINEEEKLETL